MYDSLSKRLVDGALVDVYTVGSRKELFSDGVLRMGKIIEYPSAYGVVMSGYARRLQKCFREFLKEEKATVFEVITKNVDGITVTIMNFYLRTYYKQEKIFDTQLFLIPILK